MKSKPKTKKVESLKDYYESIDLYGWWEKFSGDYAENGQYKYLTVHSFIKSRTKDKRKHEFLWWVLGPTAETPRKPEFKQFEQLDWEKKRNSGFWISNQNVERIKGEVKNRMASLDEIKATGEFNLEDMLQIKRIEDQLDLEFGGRLNIPTFSAKENKIRLKVYLELKAQLQQMRHSAQMMFAKTRNVDMTALAAMLQVVGPSMIGEQMGDDKQLTPEQKSKISVFDQATHMMLAKAAAYEMKLPDGDVENSLKPKTITIDRKRQVQ